jgi:hypothetical protein
LASPSFYFAAQAAGLKYEASASGAVTATLDSVVGVRSVTWAVASTDDTTETTDYTLTPSGSVGQIVSFTAGAAGTAGILRCTINSGVDNVTGNPSALMTTTAKWFVPAANNLEVVCADEQMESNATFGWTEPVNGAIRNASGSVDATNVLAALAGQSAGLADILDPNSGYSMVRHVKLCTAAALPAYTYNSSALGGATITYDATGVTTAIDGVVPVVNDHVWVNHGSNTGLYKMTVAGALGVATVFQRQEPWGHGDTVYGGHLVLIDSGTIHAGMLAKVSGASTTAIVVNTGALTLIDASETNLTIQAKVDNGDSPVTPAWGSIYPVDLSTGDVVFNVPAAASGLAFGRGKSFSFFVSTTGANDLTIETNSSETINGDANAAIPVTEYVFYTVLSDGTNLLLSPAV